MIEDIKIRLSVEADEEVVKELSEELEGFDEIDKVKPVQDLGAGALIITLIPTAIVIIKAIPAIYNFIKFIKELIEKSKEKIEKPGVTIIIDKLSIYNIDSKTNKAIAKKYNEILKDHGLEPFDLDTLDLDTLGGINE